MSTDNFRFKIGPNFDRRFFDAKTNAPTGWNTKDWSTEAPEVRMMSFFSAGVEDEKVLQALRDTVFNAANEDDFVRRAREAMAGLKDKDGFPVWDPARPDREGVPREKWHNDVKNLTSRARLRLIFRTQRELAAGYERFLEDFQPYALRQYPGWVFRRSLGAKTRRKDHELHKNEVRLKVDFEYWMARNNPDFGGFGNPFWPFGFNSWMRCWPVSYDTCVKLGLLREGQEPPEPGPEYDPWLKFIPEDLGKKGMDVFTDAEKERIRRRMEEEGITVQPTEEDPNTWEVVPPDEEDPWQKQEREAEEAAEEERRRQEEEQRKKEEERRAEEERKEAVDKRMEEIRREAEERRKAIIREAEERRKEIVREAEERRKQLVRETEERLRRQREEAKRQRDAQRSTPPEEPRPTEPQTEPSTPAPNSTPNNAPSAPTPAPQNPPAPTPQTTPATPATPRTEPVQPAPAPPVRPVPPTRPETPGERLARLRRETEEDVEQRAIEILAEIARRNEANKKK